MIEPEILVIEDDDMMQTMLKDTLTKQGYKPVIAGDGIAGWELFQARSFPVVLLDLKLPKLDGLAVLKKIRDLSPDTVVIMMTGYGTVETAVEAMKLGAFDYITKPFLAEEIVIPIQKGIELYNLKQENNLLRQELQQRYSLVNIIGKSRVMQDIYRTVEIVAPSNSTVLIEGESGTGKELLAEAIHHLSPRKNKPLIKINCAALPETLLESELFGHEKGSFTDAVARRIGRFELAHNGTIFLDDVDTTNPGVQVKLLRVLQEREFERVGGTELIKVDVRVIAAVKPDLRKLVSENKFREDLYYRLNVVPITLPPLRDRKEDIPALVDHFLTKYCQETHRKVTILPEILQVMVRYDWPGNIRELENLVERLVTLSVREEIFISDLPSYITEKKKWYATSLTKVVVETEKEHIRKVLESTSWKKKEAADILGITPKTLWQKIKTYRIE